MSSQPALTINNLSFRYRDREAPSIRELSFQVAPGELLLIAGASGSGKTTLIRCINGLIPRSYKGELSGQVLINNQDTAGLPLARLSQQVGTVLQDPERQILGTRVETEVAFGLENLGLSRPEIRRRVDDALRYLDISHLRDRETFNLSGGEKQKVALAGILAMQPGILLLDEPLASLDPASAQEALAMVRRLAGEGKTVLMVEHRVEDVLKIEPDRILFLKDGQIHYLGAVEGLAGAVDYREVKLPARMIMELAAGFPPPPQPAFRPAVTGPPAGAEAAGAEAAGAEAAGAEAAGAEAAGAEKRQAPAAPLVEFEQVGFGYEEGAHVLQGINLSIQRGDVVAVLGPNGAGKTTLVKHAIGLLKPLAGRVLVNGQDTRQLSIAQIASTLGYVFQSPSHMLFAPTVYEELAFGPTNLRHSPEQIQKEVNEAIEIVNLTGREKDPPLALSFGQQKRVSIAAILAMRSRILVMDEPTAGQDYKNYMDFMDAILQLPNFQAIIFITHDIDLAVIYANRVLILNQGRLVADGPPEETLRDFDWLRANRLVPTSLLQANLESLPKTHDFMRAEALAHIFQQ